MNITDKLNLYDLKHGNNYIKAENMNIAVYRNQIHFIDLTNAMKRGRECQITIMNCHEHDTRSTVALINFVDDYPLSDFCENIRKGAYLNRPELAIFGIEFENTTRASNKLFSPFAAGKPQDLSKIKRINQIVQAILAGQAKEVICKGYYTDDYAYDASVNFKIGQTQAPLDFAEELTSSRGWIAFNYNEQTKSINMAHYQFEYQQIVFK